jgi:hypothetical protein
VIHKRAALLFASGFVTANEVAKGVGGDAFPWRFRHAPWHFCHSPEAFR